MEKHHTPLRIVVREANRTNYIEVSHIIMLEASRYCTTLFLVGGLSVTVAKHLKHFQRMLPPETFIRPHHSYLINANQVQHLVTKSGCFIVMQNGMSAPVSRRRKSSITRLLLREFIDDHSH